MSTDLQKLSFSHQNDFFRKPPLSRTGSRPGSRKSRVIYPSDDCNRTLGDSSNPQNLIIKLNSSVEERTLRNDTSRTNKENHPAFLSPMSLAVSQTDFSYPIWKTGQGNNPMGNSSRVADPNRIDLVRNNNMKGVKTQETTPMSYSPSRLVPSTVALASSVCEDKSIGEQQFTEEAKSMFVENSQIELNQTLEPAKQRSGSQKKVPKWKKLKSVFHSVLLFNREEVKNIKSAKAISQEVQKFELRKQPNNAASILQPMKGNATQDALDLLRRVKVFCECAAIGSASDIEKMKQILQSDPKRYLWAPEDKEHIINSYNSQGQTPMYIAAKNGNLEVVKLLVENRANHQLKSNTQSSDGSGETPLEVAVRWGHFSIVEYLLENCKHDVQTLIKTAGMTHNPQIKKILMSYIKQNKNKRQFSLFACMKY